MNATRRAPGDARYRPAPIIDAPSQARFADTAGPGGDSLLVAITVPTTALSRRGARSRWRPKPTMTHIWGHGEGETAQKRPTHYTVKQRRELEINDGEL